MKKQNLLSLAVMALGALALAACGTTTTFPSATPATSSAAATSTAPAASSAAASSAASSAAESSAAPVATEANLVETIVAYHGEEIEMGGATSDYHWVDTIYTYDDNSYKLVASAASMGHGTGSDRAALSVTSFGSYTYGSKEDGMQSLYLSKAVKVHYAMNVYNNMFARVIDTETSEFPVYYVGDDTTSVSKDTFLEDYGYSREYSVYLDTEDNRLCDALYVGKSDKEATVTTFTQATPDEVLVAYHKASVEMGGAISDYHWVDTIQLDTEANTYEIVSAAAICSTGTGSDTAGLTVTVDGTFTFGSAEDGLQPINISAGTKAHYAMNVYNNMFARVIDSEGTFPVYYVGDDATAISKDTFMSDYAGEKKYDAYLDADDNRLCTAKVHVDEE